MAEKCIKTVIFDLDDTLIDTGPLYDRAIDDFITVISSSLPVQLDTEELRRLQEDIDIGAVKDIGFSKDRFPWSLAETYRVIAKQHRIEIDAALESQMESIGHSVYDSVPELLPDAQTILTLLQNRYEVILYTLGVPSIQQRKIDHHNLQRFFQKIHIVGTKDVAQLREVIGARTPASVIVIGDSLRGEIAPAVELGCQAVFFVRAKAWRFHEVEVNGPYRQINALSELFNLFGLKKQNEE